MPFQTVTGIKPQKNSLIVCAGTVTCTSVSGMGAGFMVFKDFFNSNLHHANRSDGWQNALQEILDRYHHKEEKMPPYVRIAKQDSYLGGVATVPDKIGEKGLTFEKFSDTTAKEQGFKRQYEAAIKGAVLDAKELGRPLFLQPLGIGVYGWGTQEAAEMFAAAICAADPEDQVDITIPIFNANPSSKDGQFRSAFIAEMAKRR